MRIACVRLTDILERVTFGAERLQRQTILYVNAHCLNLAYVNPHYRALLNNADLVYPDGIGVVWAARFLGGGRMEKATGADWIGPFCERAVARGWRIYMLAGKPGIARTAAAKLIQSYPGLNIVGACDGFFSEKTAQEVLQEIASVAPQVLFVGMGVPRQEAWIAAHCTALPVQVCWGVGALFDYVAGVERRAPRWMRSIALEWCWRLLVDPFGKWRRYIIGNPLFAYRVLREKLGCERPSGATTE